MDLSSYLLFVAASILLCITPGPDMLLILGRTLGQGRRAGLIAVVGVNAGAYVHLLAAVAGLSAVLAASTTAFNIVKWLGAAYLIYIGLKTFIDRRQGSLSVAALPPIQLDSQAFWQGFVSDVLNPKVAIFFVAFLPQFITSNAGSRISQLWILGITSNMIALLINISIVVLSTTVAGRLLVGRVNGPLLNKAMGTMFVGVGVKLATEKL
jgi:threonine/homoserine/homoserine lactone efflux protein